MKHIIEILRNIGKIVILLFQIGYVSIVDYIRPYDKPKPNEDDVAKSLGHMDENGRYITRNKLNNKVFEELSRLKKSDIVKEYKLELELEKYKKEELESLQVVHERPIYNIKPE